MHHSTGPFVTGISFYFIDQWQAVAPMVIVVDQILSGFNQTNAFDAERIAEYIVILQKYIGVVPICFNLAIFVAVLLTFFNLYRMLINYREHCAQVIRGDYSLGTRAF